MERNSNEKKGEDLNKLLFLLLTILSLRVQGQKLVYSSYELERAMSLDDLYLLAFDHYSPKSCYNKFVELNIDLNPKDKEEVGTLIYLPSKEECAYVLPSAMHEITESLTLEEIEKKHFSVLQASAGYFYSTIKGKNSENDTTLVLNSINNFQLKALSNFHFDKWQLEASITSHFIEFENSIDIEVKNTKQNLSYMGLDAIYKWKKEWSFLISQSIGEGILHNGDGADLKLFKYYKWTGQVGLLWSKEYAKSLRSSVKLSGGHSIAFAHGDDDPEGGLNYSVSLKMETIKEGQKNYFVELTNFVQNESSGNYDQELIMTGISGGVSIEF